MLSAVAGSGALALVVAGFTVGTTAAPSNAQSEPTGADCLDAVTSGPAAKTRQRAFAAAAATYGVPSSVLLGVSYLESRWDDHGAAPSTSGGYGPMHLTDVDVPDNSLAKGDGTVVKSDGPDSLHTADIAADLTKLSVRRLTSDDAANICGGAALLASYQADLGKPTGAQTTAASWYDAVRSYSGAAEIADADVFAQRVYATIKSGESRTTKDGQRVTLAAQPQVAVREAPGSAAEDTRPDCPTTIACEWIPAPYEWYGEPNPYAYGNHDLANRPTDMDIDYIVVHDTETSYDGTIRLVTNPRYVSWQYTLRSSDGHIAQHVDAENVAWHAGNWYFNMKSIGLEHEGYAAQGAAWYTEAMYRTSAQLVRHLAAKYDVPLDRAHIIGHDQIPGITPAYVRGMHWDPGPYWDWEHYMDLIGAPIKPDRRSKSDVWTVAPGFEDNVQPLTGCSGSGPCTPQGTNFVYLHTQPDASSPLVKDAGLRPDGSYSTTHVSDHGARLAAGQKVVVAKRSGDWAGVWYLGEIGWLYTPKSDPVLLPSDGATVSPKPGAASAPVYGRAYPEKSAYAGTTIPYQTVTPLQYTIKAGQKYSLADADVQTQYYYAKTYDDSLADDHTVVNGQDKYYEIWFGHRMFFVRAADVVVNQ
jgi:N-acetyl-anhydromuramyl-L-alanine amidase AmpD